MKITPFIFAAVLSLISCSNKEKNIIAQVNGENITVDDFRFELRIYPIDRSSMESSANSAKYLEIKKELLNSMIRDKILVSEAVEKKITVSDNELNEQLKLIQDDYPGDQFNSYLHEKGIDYNYWKNKMRNSILIKKLTGDVTKGLSSISEVEISDYYAKNQTSFAVPEQVHAYQIVVKTEEEAYKILGELKQGKKFEDLALKYSLTPEGKNGGDMGYFSRGSMPNAFENALFKLGEGRISKVVASEYGYHIFKVADKKTSRISPLQEVRDKIVADLLRDKKDRAFTEWFKDKIAKAKIKRNNTLLVTIK